MGERTGVYMVLVGKPRERDHLLDLDVDGCVQFKVNLQEVEWGGGHELDESDSRWGQVVGSYECGNEPSCSINCAEFID